MAPVAASPAKPVAELQLAPNPVVAVSSPARAASPAPAPVSVASPVHVPSSPARVASPAFATPVRPSGQVASTPKTILQSDAASPGFGDESDDVVLAPDLQALSAQSAPSSRIPDFVRPAVTVANPVLPDSSWLTPPMGHKLSSALARSPSPSPSPSPSAPVMATPKVLHMGTPEKTTRSSGDMSPASFVAPGSLPRNMASPANVQGSPDLSHFNVSAGNPVFTPLQQPQSFAATPVASIGGPSGSLNTIFTPQHQGSPGFTPKHATPVVSSSPVRMAPFSEQLDLAQSPAAQQAAAAEEQDNAAADASFEQVQEDQPEVPTFGGYGLLSPIREETDEYAEHFTDQKLTMTPQKHANAEDNNTSVFAAKEVPPTTPIKSEAAVASVYSTLPQSPAALSAPVATAPPTPAAVAPSPAAPAVVAVSVPSSPAREAPVLASSAQSSPFRETFGAVQQPLSYSLESPKEATLATPARVAMVSPLVSPPSQAVPARGEENVRGPATASLAAAASSGEQSELDRIKQKIRVWDATSPHKMGSAVLKAQTPEKQPRYTAEEVAAVKERAERAAAEENARLRAEYAELQSKYEAEKSLGRQMKEIVDEFEASVRVLVDGHKSAMAAEKNAFAKLQAENLALLELVEENQKKVNRLNEDKLKVVAEVEAAAAAARLAEETAAKLTAQLESSTNKYQSMKQQAGQKLALANERIQQQLSVNQDQIALIKGKLAAAVAKNEELTSELATKKKENQELVTICDQLVHQLEAASK